MAKQPVPPSDGDVGPMPEQGDPWERGCHAAGRVVASEEAELAAFRRFQQFLRQQEMSPRRTARRRRGDSDDEGEEGFGGGESRGSGGGASGPPPSWDGLSPFEDYLIRAQLWLATTKVRPRNRGPLLLKAMSGVAFESLKHYAKDAQWLQDEKNAERLLADMDQPEKFGEDRQEHMLTALSRITFHMKRQKGESWREYFVRWESAMLKVKEHKIQLPAEFEGFLLINHLELNEADTKALLNFTYGSIKPTDIKNWLRKSESRLSASELGSDRKKAHPVLLTENHLTDEDDQDHDDDDIDVLEAYLTKLQTGPTEDSQEETLDEDEAQEAQEILSTMLQQKKKAVTFKQSLQKKKDKELGRGYGRGGGPGRFEGNIRAKFTIEEVKKRTKCKACGQLGHWHRDPECPKRREDSKTHEGHHLETLAVTSEAFFLGMLEHEHEEIKAGPSSSESPMTEPFLKSAILADRIVEDRPSEQCEDYMSSNPEFDDRLEHDGFECFHVDLYGKVDRVTDDTCATLDTGCQRLAVGIHTLQRFMRHLPAPLHITMHDEVNRFKSIHGISTTTKVASVPVSLGQKGCFLRPAVFQEGAARDAPFLMSLSFLRHCNAVITLGDNGRMSVELGTRRTPYSMPFRSYRCITSSTTAVHT